MPLTFIVARRTAMPAHIIRLCSLALLLSGLSGCGDRDASTDFSSMSPHERELRRAYSLCAGCHDTDPARGHRVGPNLHGVIGRTAGTEPGYRYSEAMARSGIIWDAQNLDEFLKFPTHKVPGTKMVNATVDPARRQAIIEYLQSLE